MIEEYLDDFFSSLNNQTIDDFDKLIFNDNFNKDLRNYRYNEKVIFNENDLGIIEARKFIIDYAIEHDYDLLIFADADDVMANDRVEKLIASYEKEVSFLYNNFYYLSNKEEDFFNGKLPSEVKYLDRIKEYNFLGMSHTAINLQKEKEVLRKMPIKNKIIAFDWYLYSYLLFNGAYGKKVNTKCYYRLYDEMTAGETKTLTAEKLDTGIKIKKSHYDIMKRFDESYSELLEKIIKLEKKLNDEEFKQRYVQYINQNFSDSSFWWENIKTLDKIKGGIKDD